MYRLHYRRTWNLGNYESESAEIERDFGDEIPPDTGYATLKAEIESLKTVEGKKPEKLVTNRPALNPITISQKNFILKLITDQSLEVAQVNAKIKKTFNVDDVTKLNRMQASALIDTLQKGKLE